MTAPGPIIRPAPRRRERRMPADIAATLFCLGIAAGCAIAQFFGLVPS